jgi:hypothetical protein
VVVAMRAGDGAEGGLVGDGEGDEVHADDDALTAASMQIIV